MPVPTRLVLLGDELLVAARRWPSIVSCLHTRMFEDSEDLVRQLAICQLPRVEDRIMAMMWLLAESWGRVTPAGIKLPLSLTHEVLGGLIGARRPTVTIALSKLAERGSLHRRGDEWLILEAPATPVSTEPKAPQLLLTAPAGSRWAAPDPVEQGPEGLRSLIRHVADAREGFAQDRRRAGELAEEARALREESQRLRTDPRRES
ncbi:MAG TPA: helix-turn-helix domain-containing protein [Solirubrobacteraceae bacterium]|nr:helix-turn-helix domain-containing protein [Solirubrobacteraceae bacterium]